MKNASITKILKAARKAVSFEGSGTSWTIVMPYSYDDLSGPYTTMNASDYWKARSVASSCKLSIALVVAGVEGDDYGVEFAAREMLADGYSWTEVATAFIKHYRGIPHGITFERAARMIESAVIPAKD